MDGLQQSKSCCITLAFAWKVCSIYMIFHNVMPYVISTVEDGINYCITADKETMSFQLIPVESDSDLSHVFSHPYQSGALNILRWIQHNDHDLSSKDLVISDEGRFRH